MPVTKKTVDARKKAQAKTRKRKAGTSTAAGKLAQARKEKLNRRKKYQD